MWLDAACSSTHQPLFGVNVVRNEKLVTVAVGQQVAYPLDPLRVTRHVRGGLELVVRDLYSEQIIFTVAAEGSKLHQLVVVVDGTCMGTFTARIVVESFAFISCACFQSNQLIGPLILNILCFHRTKQL